MRNIILTLISAGFFILAGAQDKSNRGKEFWTGYGFNGQFFNTLGVLTPNSQELAIYISTEQAATVTVSINNTGWTQTLNIPANTADASILIPKSGVDDARILTDGLFTKGIHIVSDVPVAVYAHQYATQFSAATMLMPVESYGYSYYSVNYYQTRGTSPLPVINSDSNNWPNWYNWFFAIATEDNTRIEITPSDTTNNGWLPGQTYTVNLNKGELYTVFGKATFPSSGFVSANINSSKDLTGSKIVSVTGSDGKCHPIGLFSGSGGIQICRGDGGEAMQQQVFPLQAWGTRYLTFHTINNTNTDINEPNRNYYRICVKDPTTVVKKNGVVMTGIIKNFFYESTDSVGGDYFESDKPILVTQYTPNKNQCWNYPTTTPAPPSYGDPEMFYLSPIEQGQKQVLFYTGRKSGIDYVYANIHLPTTAVASLKVDGVSLPASQVITHPNFPASSVALARLVGPAAQHTISCDSTFTATVYGLGNYESYGYNVGCRINNLNSYGSFKNVFSAPNSTDTFTCPNTPIRLFIKTAYHLNSINWKLSQVGTGINPSADSLILNPIPIDSPYINNRKYYTYTLQQDFTFNAAGTFDIPVEYTSADIDNCGQVEIFKLRVLVKPGPVANFTISTPNCLSDTAYLTGTSVANGFNIGNYLWNFDDASTQATVNAKKKFLTPGLQHIRYRIYADNGCAGDTTKTVTIFDTPLAKFGATTPICAKDSVLFTDTSSITIGSISTWQWNFGDGNTLTRNSNTPFYHQYLNPGTFTVKLLVNSNNSCKSDTFSRSVTVNPLPFAKFGYSGNICINDSIRFTDTSSIAGGSISSWRWNFGDGNTLVRNTNTPFFHPYTTTGSFVVTLVTVSGFGCVSDTFRRTVTVNAKPVVTFTISGKPCIDSNFLFTSSIPYSNTNPATWYWNFGDAQIFSTITTNTALHKYSSALTNISVRHVLSYGPGCSSDTAVLIIPAINPNPVASFSLSAPDICQNSDVNIIAPAGSNITAWLWNFGNGTGNQAPPFTRSYANAGTFAISLITTGTGGCNSVPFSSPLNVHPIPVINAGPDQIILTGSSVTLGSTLTNATNYNILWTPSLYLSSSTVLNPVSTPPVSTTYHIEATDKLTSCSAGDDVTINVVSKLFIPNAFTPNGDGKNDKWNIPGMALYPDAVMSIYNRYGQKIFESKNYTGNPWDGTYQGKKQANGVYIYIINFSSGTIEKGTVNIIR